MYEPFAHTRNPPKPPPASTPPPGSNVAALFYPTIVQPGAVNIFFSQKNVNFLQQKIIAAVANLSQNKYIIQEQDQTALIGMMNTVYEDNRTGDITKLNEMTIRTASDNIVKNIYHQSQYVQTLDPVSLRPKSWQSIFELPQSTNTTKSTQLEFLNPF